MSLLDAPASSTGIYFWANGIDWNTENKADLDAAEEFLVNEFAPHIKAFDSYPASTSCKGSYALSQAWNGDARAGLLAVEDAGDDAQVQVGPRRSDRPSSGWTPGAILRAREPRGRVRLHQLHPRP